MKTGLDDPILRQQPPFFIKTTTSLQPPYSVFLKSNSGSLLIIYLLFIFGQHSSDQQSLQVAFDVYQPGVNFKKTDPGPPHFCITVCRYELTRVSEIRTNLLERPPIHNTKKFNVPPKTLY